MDMTDLPPGRELDALVAEKVMGWTSQQFPDGAMPEVKHWSPPGETTRMVPLYSTDWRAAGEVLEKMDRPLLRQFMDGTWYCIHGSLVALEHALRKSSRVGKTGPHAICLAALAAVTVAVGDE